MRTAAALFTLFVLLSASAPAQQREVTPPVMPVEQRFTGDFGAMKQREIAIGMRPNSPELKSAVNAFIKTHGAGTLNGNMLLKRYLSSTKFAKNAMAAAEMQRFQEIVALFQKYGGQYDMDSC
jgi:hypothetical protein